MKLVLMFSNSHFIIRFEILETIVGDSQVRVGGNSSKEHLPRLQGLCVEIGGIYRFCVWKLIVVELRMMLIDTQEEPHEKRQFLAEHILSFN